MQWQFSSVADLDLQLRKVLPRAGKVPWLLLLSRVEVYVNGIEWICAWGGTVLTLNDASSAPFVEIWVRNNAEGVGEEAVVRPRPTPAAL